MGGIRAFTSLGNLVADFFYFIQIEPEIILLIRDSFVVSYGRLTIIFRYKDIIMRYGLSVEKRL